MDIDVHEELLAIANSEKEDRNVIHGMNDILDDVINEPTDNVDTDVHEELIAITNSGKEENHVVDGMNDFPDDVLSEVTVDERNSITEGVNMLGNL